MKLRVGTDCCGIEAPIQDRLSVNMLEAILELKNFLRFLHLKKYIL